MFEKKTKRLDDFRNQLIWAFREYFKRPIPRSQLQNYLERLS